MNTKDKYNIDLYKQQVRSASDEVIDALAALSPEQLDARLDALGFEDCLHMVGYLLDALLRQSRCETCGRYLEARLRDLFGVIASKKEAPSAK